MKPSIKLTIATGLFIALIILTKVFGTSFLAGPKEDESLITDEEIFAVSEDTSGILQTFFPEGELVASNLIRWKPDMENRLQMNVSKDGFCYTSLDTVITSESAETKYYYIFTTNYYSDTVKIKCKACEPDISIGIVEGYSNVVTAFYKKVDRAGEYGTTGNFELISLGYNKEILQLNTTIHSNGGGKHKFISLIDADKLKVVLKFESFASNEETLDDPYGINYGLSQKEVELTTTSGKNGIYDLVLNQKETSFDTIHERLTTKFTTKVYRWNENEELELCYE